MPDVCVQHSSVEENVGEVAGLIRLEAYVQGLSNLQDHSNDCRELTIHSPRPVLGSPAPPNCTLWIE